MNNTTFKDFEEFYYFVSTIIEQDITYFHTKYMDNEHVDRIKVITEFHIKEEVFNSSKYFLYASMFSDISLRCWLSQFNDSFYVRNG